MLEQIILKRDSILEKINARINSLEKENVESEQLILDSDYKIGALRRAATFVKELSMDEMAVTRSEALDTLLCILDGGLI